MWVGNSIRETLGSIIKLISSILGMEILEVVQVLESTIIFFNLVIIVNGKRYFIYLV